MAHKITPFLMFEGVAEDAMKLYISLFKNSKISHIERYGSGEQGAEGSIKRADFIVGGQHLICIDSPIQHDFSFTPAMSIFVDCEDEQELHNVFKQLSLDGSVLMSIDNYVFSKQFGWLNYRFGVSWQLNLE
ncbi:VOC family protein [filamentous cyanobacterium LEGE 11480]|uniref:VOC family protein n=1 Tax=Romeriopsis navalis LEGE 11480 TaxID=2777977 RepID=A0A928Z4Q5_9CYAN|nr:VOC family protein [Romeriopsis navalis]MBE9030618.1 VOC family protein [Romeriopsis navalis LEGE 11480]